MRKFPLTSSKKDVTFSDLTQPITVHMGYQYTLDDIKLVWATRFKEIMEQWFIENHINELPEIIIPDYEISTNTVDETLPGNLVHFLKTVVFVDNQSAASSNTGKAKFVYIPINTGGHWVTLCLSVKNNAIETAIYLDSLGGVPFCRSLLQVMKGQNVELPKDDDALLKELNQASQTLDMHIGAKLNEQSSYVKCLQAADPTFKGHVDQRCYLLQSDSVFCGAASVEAGFECLKMIVSGAKHIIRPTWCDQNDTAIIRARHARAVGIDTEFDQRQRDNKQNVEDHTYRMLKMEAPIELNDAGRLLLAQIRKLDSQFQESLMSALKPLPDEEHAGHLKRIRNAIVLIKTILNIDVDDNTEMMLQLNEFIQTLTGNALNYRSIPIEEGAEWDLKITMDGDFDQLMKVGRVLRKEEPEFNNVFSGFAHSFKNNLSGFPRLFAGLKVASLKPTPLLDPSSNNSSSSSSSTSTSLLPTADSGGQSNNVAHGNNGSASTDDPAESDDPDYGALFFH